MDFSLPGTKVQRNENSTYPWYPVDYYYAKKGHAHPILLTKRS